MNDETGEMKICTCACHKDGEDVMHFMECCDLCYLKYINANGKIDMNRWVGFRREIGMAKWGHTSNEEIVKKASVGRRLTRSEYT